MNLQENISRIKQMMGLISEQGPNFELPKDVHPYYVGTQAHPEFLSRPTRAHPLFAGLIAAAIVKHGK